MAAEPRNDTGDMSQLVWDNSTELPQVGNEIVPKTTDITGMFEEDEYNNAVISSISLLISLYGMVGNGTVIWLLGFRVKRNPYSVYILNLAFADFIYLLANVLDFISSFTENLFDFYFILDNLIVSSYPLSLTLLMAISAERCVSVLWPLWYKCHRPVHLSTIVCALIWGLFFIYFLLGIACSYSDFLDWNILMDISDLMCLPTILVLFVSSLILVIWGQCCSQRRQPSKLYWTIVFNILAVLLFTVPRGIYAVCYWQGFSQLTIWYIVLLLSAMNSAVNPVIYFFVGRHGKQRGRISLREVLQSALTEEEAGTEQRRGINNPRQNRTTPEHQRGGAPPSPQV